MSTAAKVGAFFLVVLAIAGAPHLEDRGPPHRTGKAPQGHRRSSGTSRDWTRSRRCGSRASASARCRRSGSSRARRSWTSSSTRTSRCGREPPPRSRASGFSARSTSSSSRDPFGAGPLPDNAVIVGGVPVSFDEITKLARDIEVDIKDDHDELEGIDRRSAGGGAAGGHRREHADHQPGSPRDGGNEPRGGRRDDRELPRVFVGDDGPRGPRGLRRSLEPGQRLERHREHPRDLGEARDDDRQPEPDHGTDPRRGGDGRQARPERRDPQEPERRPRRGEGGRRRFEQGDRRRREDEDRSRDAVGVPRPAFPRARRTSPSTSIPADVAPFLPGGALQPALRQAQGHDHDRDDDLSRTATPSGPSRRPRSGRTSSRSPPSSAIGGGTG